jgi:hypothetical protein
MPIDVLGELSVLGEGGENLRISGTGEVISVDLPSLWAGRSLARQTGGRSQRQQLIGRLQAGLRFADLTLQVRVGGKPIARLAPHSEGTLLSRLLGLGALELSPVAVIAAAFRR